MKFLTKEEILGIADIKTEPVEVPEWGGCVLVRGLTGTGRDQYEQDQIERKGKKVDVNLSNARAKLIALTVVDESGKLMFNDKDVHALGRKSAAAMERVYNKAMQLSGLNASDIEDLSKNSPTGQSDASISA